MKSLLNKIILWGGFTLAILSFSYATANYNEINPNELTPKQKIALGISALGTIGAMYGLIRSADGCKDDYKNYKKWEDLK